MKQSSSVCVSSSSSIMLTPLESEVVEILVELPSTILELKSQCRFLFTWGGKGRRSAIRFTPSPSPFHHQPSTSSPKAEAPSPATPLSFSPSESEDKSAILRKNVSLKRKREHYLKIIQELTKDNDLLHGEIKNVKCYFNQLKDFNLKLKARKQELSLGQNQDDAVREQFPGTAHSLPLIFNRTASAAQISDSGGGVEFQSQHACGQLTASLGKPSSSGSGSALGNSNNMGPIGIPDLNLLPLEVSMGVDSSCEALDVNRNVSRAIAAQARQKRIQIYRVKNPVANSKMRYFCR